MAIEFSWTDLLARVALFSTLDRTTLTRLADYFEPVKVAAGTDVCRLGDASDGLYVITGGRFGAYGPSPIDGGETEMNRLVTGDFFGELSLLSREPRQETIRAVDNGTLARLTNHKFEELLANDTTIAQAIAIALVHRLSDSYAQLEIKIAERTRDVKDALDRQQAISGVMKMISRSAYNLDLVMALCLEGAVRFCDAQFGIIYRQGASELELSTFQARDPELDSQIRATGARLEAGAFASWVQREGKVLNLANVVDSDVFDKVASLFTSIDLKAALGVPLLQLTQNNPGELAGPPQMPAGVLAIFRTDDVPFSSIHVDLAETFADQAAIAIENVRLLTEVKQKTKEVEELRIEIDEAMRVRQVSEITGSDFFQEIQGKAKELRAHHRIPKEESPHPPTSTSSLFGRVGRPPND